VDTHGERGEREPTTGVWGSAPSGVQRQSPWSGGQEGEAPLKLKSENLLAFGAQWKPYFANSLLGALPQTPVVA